jgi:hypothetical protein
MENESKYLQLKETVKQCQRWFEIRREWEKGGVVKESFKRQIS